MKTRLTMYFTLVLLLSLLFSQNVLGEPYQFIYSESAILIKKGDMETKLLLSNESGSIPTQARLLQQRWGISSWLEAAINLTHADFIDQNETRISEYEFKVKLKIPKSILRRTFLLVKYREAQGDPVIVDYTGELDRVEQMVSPHADQGKDLSMMFMRRNSFRLFKRRIDYTMGIEYTQASEREFGDFGVNQQEIVSLYFSPEIFFLKNMLMLAIENKYTYWNNRGDYWDTIPQLRWEFVPDWVLEFGYSYPVIGGNIQRSLMGFTFQY